MRKFVQSGHPAAILKFLIRLAPGSTGKIFCAETRLKFRTEEMENPFFDDLLDLGLAKPVLDNAFDCFSPLTRYSRCRQGDQMSL
jgi:hypothetical protein